MNSSNTTAHGQLHDWKIPTTASLAIILGLVIRLYSFTYVPLVNPDGHLYIQQAKALYYGLFDSILSCYEYLSPYPLFISLNYRFFGDWVIAAKVVSLFFGTMTLIPVYWLLRRFYTEITSSLALLCFALIPPLIVVSRHVLRDPVYWFFAMMGLYLFVLHIEKRRPLLTLLSSICLIMGAWARIEGTVFILVSTIYLLLTKHEHKWKHLLFFLLPFTVLLLLGMVYQSFFDVNIIALLKPGRLMQRLQGVFANYKGLRQSLKDLEALRPRGFSPEFFPTIRNVLWLIPLGILAVQIVETLFYIFFIILVLGVVKSVHRIPQDSRLIYLVTLSVVALIALYAQMMFLWWMSSRFTVLFLFPAFVFMGAGIEAIAAFISKRFKLKQPTAYVLICLLVLVAALPKTLRASYIKDKLVFREIGTFISIREKNRRAVSVAGSFKRVQAVHFYANLNYHGAPCFDIHAILRHPDAAAVKSVQERGYHYFIWDEKGWNNKGLDKLMEDPDSTFVKIKEWQSSRRGRLILYEVRS